MGGNGVYLPTNENSPFIADYFAGSFLTYLLLNNIFIIHIIMSSKQMNIFC